jgi:hypothetical protein
VEWRWLRGWLAEPGPGTVWDRQRVPLVAGEQPSRLRRLAVVADSGNGAAAPLDLLEWLRACERQRRGDGLHARRTTHRSAMISHGRGARTSRGSLVCRRDVEVLAPAKYCGGYGR